MEEQIVYGDRMIPVTLPDTARGAPPVPTTSERGPKCPA